MSNFQTGPAQFKYKAPDNTEEEEMLCKERHEDVLWEDPFPQNLY